MITLESIQPEDGIDAVTRFIDEATTSVDIAVYQMDPGYSPLIEALTRAKERGRPMPVLENGIPESRDRRPMGLLDHATCQSMSVSARVGTTCDRLTALQKISSVRESYGKQS